VIPIAIGKQTASMKLKLERFPLIGISKYLESVFTPPLGGWGVIISLSNRLKGVNQTVDLWARTY